MQEAIEYDASAVDRALGPSFQDSRAQIRDRLEAARRDVLDDLVLFRSGKPVPESKAPLDAAFIDLPRRLLDEYHADGADSEVGRILTTANRLAEDVDRVVVLGIGGSYMGARALFEAVGHSYHNEVDRSERGNRPRLYFSGNNVDATATAALLKLLEDSGDDWGIVVVSKSGGTLETAVAFRLFLRALEESVHDASRRSARIVPVTGTSGKLFNLSEALGCAAESRFEVPDGVGGRFSILSAVGLVPAAVVGLDIVALLEGAADLTQRFRDSSVDEDPVLNYVATGNLLETQAAVTLRVLSVWDDGMEAVGLWYDQLLAESLGKQGLGATPLTTVNSRDLHSRHQQHQEGRRDKLITNLVVQQEPQNHLVVGELPGDEDDLNRLSHTTMRDIAAAAHQGTNEALAKDRRPTAEIVLPARNEYALGQLFQMLMLATVVEGRLLGINPYGQPGVQDYKENMNRILRERQ